MKLYVIWVIIAYLSAIVIAWYPGNKLIVFLSKKIVPSSTFPKDGRQTPSKLAPRVGGLERSLYIFAVMADQYVLIAGWLVMKAFFVWIGIENEKRSDRAELYLDYYNNNLIVNLFSLFVGLFIGIVARFVLDNSVFHLTTP